MTRRSALLVIDMINDFFDPLYGNATLAGLRAEIVGAINQLISVFREHELPVIWIRQEFAEDLSDAPLLMKKKKLRINIKETEGSCILPEFDVDFDDDEIVKKRFSAFFETGLHQILQKKNIDTLVICGVKTNACIRTTAIDAYQHDYEVFIPRECVASSDENEHSATLAYLNRGIVTVIGVEQNINFIIDGN